MPRAGRESAGGNNVRGNVLRQHPRVWLVPMFNRFRRIADDADAPMVERGLGKGPGLAGRPSPPRVEAPVSGFVGVTPARPRARPCPRRRATRSSSAPRPCSIRACPRPPRTRLARLHPRRSAGVRSDGPHDSFFAQKRSTLGAALVFTLAKPPWSHTDMRNFA
jgi:hypothetical protein